MIKDNVKYDWKLCFTDGKNGTDMTKDILKKNFEDLDGHISYIISFYF